jgi:hypothetical protein
VLARPGKRRQHLRPHRADGSDRFAAAAEIAQLWVKRDLRAELLEQPSLQSANTALPR